MYGASGSRPRPFAVGVLALTARADGAGRTDALITRGPIDVDWLHALAEQHRLVIRSCEERTEPCIGGITPHERPR